tara:strand:- start:51229 stop:51420 length:192 start_codon:yes stop_codon:yes gene_type:complete
MLSLPTLEASTAYIFNDIAQIKTKPLVFNVVNDFYTPAAVMLWPKFAIGWYLPKAAAYILTCH